MTEEAKMRLLHHLVMDIDSYDVDRELTEVEELERALYRDIELETAERLSDKLMKSDSGSKEEKQIVNELMELYIPGFVTKDQIPDGDRKAEAEPDQVLAAVEDIDHPVSPPPKREITKEYLQEKQQAIKKMIDDNKNLDDRQRKTITDMLCRYQDRFSLAGENMERTETITHEIDTGTNRPFRERLRTYSPATQEIIDNEVRRMLREGVIQHSRSPYASNLLLVRKPDPSSAGGVKNRVCASFVQLNAQTVKDSYPLPNIQVMFDKVGRSKWFTTMDLLNGFWQVMVKDEHRHKTAFVTGRGLFEFVVMPFGLCNAPATFQRLMDTVIKPEYRGFIETYVDDVMTHSQSFIEHVKHLETLLTLLREHKLVVKLTKCKFAQREVKFLGHILSEGTLRPNPESVETILKWERPTQGNNRQKAVKGFLGMVGWYRKFIPKFAEIARPLFELLKKEAKWEWTPACQTAFETLRDAITSKPVLAIADPNKQYVLETDASDVALGAVLMQKDEEDHLRPIAYASKSLGPAEKRYGVTDREALAIVWALEHFNTYCEGHKYTAVTDHAALRYMLNNKDKTPRMHRMVARLSPYEITLTYRPGAENHAADLLSRQEVYMEMKTTEVNANRVSKRHANKQRKRAIPKSRRQKKDHKDYEVERIVNRRPAPSGKPNEYEYEVKWKGYDSSQNTWLSLAALGNATEAVFDFESQRQAQEIGAVEYDEDENVCSVCNEKCVGPTALIIHRYQHHQSSPAPPDQVEFTPMDADTMRTLQETDQALQFIYKHLRKHDQNSSQVMKQKHLLCMSS